MPHVDADYLRFLARWDRDEQALRQALSDRAGHEVHFTDRQVPEQATPLFGLFSRDPLDAVTERADGSRQLPYNPWRAWRDIVEER